MTCQDPCNPVPNTPPTPSSSMTLSAFISLVMNYKTNLSPFQQIWIGSIRQYTPDIREYKPTQQQIESIAPLMRVQWAREAFQGYISHQIICQQTVPNLQNVLTLCLASATLVRLSSFQRVNWKYEKHFPTQYIEITGP